MQKILFLIFLCFSFFLSGILVFAADSTTDVTSQNFIVNLGNMDPLGGTSGRTSPGGGITAFTTVIGKITDILLFMIPIFAAVSLMIAGYFYIFSAGDSEKAGRAKTIIKWNIVAMLVAFLSYGIVKIVASFFNT
jgi:hypothetical protein